MTNQSSKVDMSPKNNFIFKKIFTSPGSESILIDFLSAVLKENIIDVQLIQGESENLGEYVNSKTFRFDIKVTLADGRIIDVEMQKEDTQPIEKRLTGYAGRIVSEQLKKGEKYDDIKETIVICILNYNFIELPEYHTETITVAKQNREYELSNYIKYHFIELPKFRKSEPDLNDRLDQWLLFLDNLNRELIDMAAYKNEEIKKAEEIHKTLKANENIREILDAIEWAEFERNSQISYMKKKVENATKELEDTTKELDNTTKELDNTTKELEDTTKELEDTTKELDNTTKELEDTTKELDNTRQKVKNTEEELENAKEQIKNIKQEVKNEIQEGIKQGSTTEKIKMAKRLLDIKMSVEQISEITELSKEEIEQFKNIK